MQRRRGPSPGPRNLYIYYAMTASAFVTRIETHRDPTLLWPLVGVLSILTHGLVWLGVQPLRITPMPRVEVDPIPVQLWLDTPDVSGTEAVEPSPSRAVAAPPAAAATGESPAPPIAPTANQPPPIPAPAVSAPPPIASPSPASPLAPVVEPSPPPSVEPAPPSPVVAPPPPITPAVPPPAPPAMPPAPVTPVSPPAPTPAPTPAPSQAGGGELSPVGLYAAAFGTDFPDTPPKLLDNTSLNLQPWLATCGWQNLGAIASPGLTARVQLQLQVQPDGTVSQATVLEGTGNTALDNLVSCVVQHQLRLQPATTAGSPQLTDAFILDTQVRF